jgi:hypothetical protein
VSRTPMVRNVTRVFREASPDQREAGREWYGRATRLAAELATSLPTDHRHYGDTDRAAAVIAVLSPRLNWRENVAMARQAYAMTHGPWAFLVSTYTNALPTLRINARKAGRLLATDEDTTDIVSGPKVTAFWRTIADPTNPWAVVVDRHAYDVSVGRVTDNDERMAGLRGKRYDAVCDVYRRAAVILSRETGETITPAIVQATTWTVWRETMIRTRHASLAERETFAAAA